MQQTGTVRIVLVDDDEGHRTLIRRNLERAGITNPIVELSSGTEALDYFLSRPYASKDRDGSDLLLLDINMESPDGIEVLRQIKGNTETKAIPIIMLTTTADPREIDRCYDLGCNIYVSKPGDPQSFMEAITRLGLFISILSPPPRDHGRPQ